MQITTFFISYVLLDRKVVIKQREGDKDTGMGTQASSDTWSHEISAGVDRNMQ
jgi:hypothetical protein